MSIIDYFDSALGEGTYHSTSKGSQYSYNCPICDDHKERLFVNIDRQAVWCHNCEYGASTITFISDYSSIDWREALDIFREYEGREAPLPEDLESEVKERLLKLHKNTEVKIQKYVHPLPEEFILLEEAKGSAGRKAIEYMVSRGITMDTCEKNYVGYCEEGKYANRIILPDFEDGELVYWQARTWLPTPKDSYERKRFRKVLNPSLSEEQIKQGIISIDKSEVVSNIDIIKDKGMAVLVEGRFDSLTVGDIGGCIHGKHLSDDQFIKLISNKDKIHTVAVMMDGDAFSSTLNISKRLYEHFDTVLVCKLPQEADPNSLGTKECLNIIGDAIKYSPMAEVKMKLRGWV